MEYIDYGNRKIPILYNIDCCVCGGGTSGASAAIMAAREGLSTVVLEKGIVLGGSQTQALVLPFMPTYVEGSDTNLIKEIKYRMLEYGIDMDDKVTNFGWFNPEKIAYIYDEMLKESGGEVLYNVTLIDSIVEKGEIKYAVIHTIEGLQAIKAKIFVDATGDAVLSRVSGIEVESGYEKTGNNQPMSFRFEMGGIDFDKLSSFIDSINCKWCATKPPYFEIAMARGRDIIYDLEYIFINGYENGELELEDIEYFQAFTIIGKPGSMSMNCPEIPVKYKSTKAIDISKAIVKGREMIQRISKFLKNNMPGFENSFIIREASMIGVRESFRIKGKYFMTEDDYYNRRTFDDAVAKTAWYIDAHGEKVGDYLEKGEYYEIPYRALVTNEIKNLIVCGRCISASFILQASMRIQPSCMTLGETAGVAAKYSIENDICLNEIKWNVVENSIKPYKK